jgi:hypothetical protein
MEHSWQGSLLRKTALVWPLLIVVLEPVIGRADFYPVGAAAPQPGETVLQVDGRSGYVEIPSAPALSPSTTGQMTIAVWVRPDTVDFPTSLKGRVAVLGKGDQYGPNGNQELGLVFYNRTGTEQFENPPRPNRLSGYLWNSSGGLGVGSYMQDMVFPREWIFVTLVVDGHNTRLYTQGQFRRCDSYTGVPSPTCESHTDRDGSPLVITPTLGTAALRVGTMNPRESFFPGAFSRMRIWNRALSGSEIESLYRRDSVLPQGLVAEYLMNEGSAVTVYDGAGGNHGTLNGGAFWSQAGADEYPLLAR